MEGGLSDIPGDSVKIALNRVDQILFAKATKRLLLLLPSNTGLFALQQSNLGLTFGISFLLILFSNFFGYIISSSDLDSLPFLLNSAFSGEDPLQLFNSFFINSLSFKLLHFLILKIDHFIWSHKGPGKIIKKHDLDFPLGMEGLNEPRPPGVPVNLRPDNLLGFELPFPIHC